jgi:branched-chain amino acid transport system substrate-binding protein
MQSGGEPYAGGSAGYHSGGFSQAQPQPQPAPAPARPPPGVPSLGRTAAIAVAIIAVAAVVSVGIYFAFPATVTTGAGGGEVTLKVGVILSQTGQLGHGGSLMVKGAKLKADEVNAAGGFRMGSQNAKIELVIEDDMTSSVQGSLSAHKLVNVDKVQAIVGDTGSSICLAINEVTEKAKVPTVSPSCTSPKLSLEPWIFRTVGSDLLQGEALVDTVLAMNGAGVSGKKIALMSIHNAYGDGVREVVLEKAAKKGLEVIFDERFLENQVDYDSQGASLKGAKDAKAPGETITVVYVSYPEDAITFFGTASKLGLTHAAGYRWLGTDGIADSDVLTQDTNINAFIQGVYATNPLPKPGDSSHQKFQDAFRAKYGERPTAFSATAYDAMGAIVAAISKAGKYDGQAIKDALNSFTGADAYGGVSGTKDFDGNGDIRAQTYQIVKVQGNSFVATGGWWEDPSTGVQDFKP